MAAKKSAKTNLEITLVSVELDGVPEKALAKSRNLGCVDLIWPRTGIAKKSAAREMVLKRGKADFTEEPWVKRILFREEVDGHCGIAVSITEPVTVQLLRKFVRLAAKYALKQGADFIESAMVGYGDIASSPVDALAAMVGTSDAPKAIAQGVVDLVELPADGEEKTIEVELLRPLTKKRIGAMRLGLRG